MARKSFEEWLNQLLTDFKNQHDDPDSVDISIGSPAFIRFACSASIAWALEIAVDYAKNQAFPTKCDIDALREHAFNVRGLSEIPNESKESLRARYLDDLRDPPAGGKKSDFERWAKEYIMPYSKLDLSTATITASGIETFDAALLIDGTVSAQTAWDLANSPTIGSYVKIDLGSNKELLMALIYAEAAGHSGTYEIQYSDNAIDWTFVANFAPNLAYWNKIEWPSVGAHRYWRYRLSNSPDEAGSSFSEIEFYIPGSEQATFAKYYPESEITQAGTAKIAILGPRTGDAMFGYEDRASNGLCIKVKEYLDLKSPGSPRYLQVTTPQLVYPVVGCSLQQPSNEQFQMFVEAVLAMLYDKKPGEPFISADLSYIARSIGIKNILIHTNCVDVSANHGQMIRPPEWGIGVGTY
jgi:hypothetical protein